MKAYHGKISSGKTDDVLKHYGSLTASVNRVGSMFLSQNRVNYDGFRFVSCDIYGMPKSVIHPEELHAKFIKYLTGVEISEFELNINNPLHITDHWADDPIGSASIKMFEGNQASLSDEQLSELQTLFHPFKNIIYPDSLSQLEVGDLKKMRSFIRGNSMASKQLIKRKSRSKAIGEDFSLVADVENVWIYLTAKFREWALKNKYDSFLYQNNEEGEGCNSFVTLKTKQAENTGALVFDIDAYKKRVSPLFSKAMQSHTTALSRLSPIKFGDLMLWAGEEPTSFLKQGRRPQI